MDVLWHVNQFILHFISKYIQFTFFILGVNILVNQGVNALCQYWDSQLCLELKMCPLLSCYIVNRCHIWQFHSVLMYSKTDFIFPISIRAVLLQSFHSWLKPKHPSIMSHYWGNYPGSTWVTCWINLSHTLHTRQCVVNVWSVNHTDHYSTPRGQGPWPDRLSNQHPCQSPCPNWQGEIKICVPSHSFAPGNS